MVQGRSAKSAPPAAILGITIGLIPCVLLATRQFPPTWVLVILGLLPIGALGATAASGRRLSLGIDAPIDRRPSLAGLFFGPMAGLGFFLLNSGDRLYWTEVTWRWAAAAAVVACGIGLLVAVLDRRAMSDTLMVGLTALFSFVWLCGVVAAIDLNGPVETCVLTPTLVAAKQHYSSRGGSSWKTTLRTADGRFQETVQVRRETYYRLSIGMPWCLVRGRGALGIWWRDSAPCQPTNRPAP